jgi:hypothetical protein
MVLTSGLAKGSTIDTGTADATGTADDFVVPDFSTTSTLSSVTSPWMRLGGCVVLESGAGKLRRRQNEHNIRFKQLH